MAAGFMAVRRDALLIAPELVPWVAFGLRRAIDAAVAGGGRVPGQVLELAEVAEQVAVEVERPAPVEVPTEVPSVDRAGSDRVRCVGTVTVPAAAARLGCSPAYVRRLVRLGRLRGSGGGRGRAWEIDASSVDEFEEVRRGRNDSSR